MTVVFPRVATPSFVIKYAEKHLSWLIIYDSYHMSHMSQNDSIAVLTARVSNNWTKNKQKREWNWEMSNIWLSFWIFKWKYYYYCVISPSVTISNNSISSLILATVIFNCNPFWISVKNLNSQLPFRSKLEITLNMSDVRQV